MKLHWEIEKEDIARGKAFLRAQMGNDFVKSRIVRNVGARTPRFSKERFWQKMIGCLLTTQQRSGPESAVTRFMLLNPHPLSYYRCIHSRELEGIVEGAIRRFGGIRRGKSIAREVKSNLMWLEEDGWKEVRDFYRKLTNNQSPDEERKAVEIVRLNMAGFGPKQSRNFLQDLGLTRYVVPIDSRITKWLNRAGFPLRLSATALSDPSYYDFVETGFHALCKAIGTFPCVMDAAIFSSFDEARHEKE
jgi:hypothetical protein